VRPAIPPLQRLFERYDRRYWRGKLSRVYAVENADLSKNRCLGICYRKTRKIVLDITAHSKDRERRATLLREMAHAADNSKSGHAHGDGFLAQIEYLLRQRAPITLQMPELGAGHNSLWQPCRRSSRFVVGPLLGWRPIGPD